MEIESRFSQLSVKTAATEAKASSLQGLWIWDLVLAARTTWCSGAWRALAARCCHHHLRAPRPREVWPPARCLVPLVPPWAGRCVDKQALGDQSTKLPPWDPKSEDAVEDAPVVVPISLLRGTNAFELARGRPGCLGTVPSSLNEQRFLARLGRLSDCIGSV
mmetsp:Transcript_46610/g.101525  ORF Transcript_46610/g.101525 Transcript_46610/m.101525 type:complete len:162 (-) Transcript_46610:239-724(-)